jgi:hypothetical protein
MEITETVKTGLTESPQQRLVFYPNTNDSPQEDGETPVSLSDSTESSLVLPALSPTSVEPNTDHVSLSEEAAGVDPSEASFREIIEPLPSEETMDQIIPALEEVDVSLERKRHLESLEPTPETSSEEFIEESPSCFLDRVEAAALVGTKEIVMDVDIPRVSEAEEVIFIGNVESRHEPEESDAHDFEENMTFSDEDILNLSPTELEQLLQKMKAATATVKSSPGDSGSSIAHPISGKDILPELFGTSGFSSNIRDTAEMVKPPAHNVAESEELVLSIDLQKDDVAVKINACTINGSIGEMLIYDPLPLDEVFNDDAVEEMGIEDVALDEGEVAEVFDDAFAVSPEEVLEAVKEFASVVPSPLELTDDTQDLSTDRCLDGALERTVHVEAPCAFRATLVDIDSSIPDEAAVARYEQEYAIANVESIAANAPVTTTTTQAHPETIGVEIGIPDEVDEIPRDEDRFGVFEKVWREPNTVGVLLTNIGDVANTDHLKSPLRRDAPGSVEFLYTQKGSAYAEYAKRSAHKPQQMKEELVNEERNESALIKYAKRSAQKLQQAKDELLKDEFIEVERILDIVATDETKVNADGLCNSAKTSALGTPDDEIVRVPTSEEMKPAVNNPESAATSCLGTCVVM